MHPKVTVATIVKNESDRFLRKALECWVEVSDKIVAVDNGSTDGTVELLREFGCIIHELDTPMDGHETVARQFLWEKALEDTPDDGWIIHLDADHCVAGDFREHLTGDRVKFPVFDMWSPTAYRSDAWWIPRHWWQGVRITAENRNSEWIWPDRGWHSGHVPANAGQVFGNWSKIPWECGILHYGYATDALRESHADAYEARAAVLTDQELFHAKTIRDHAPRVEGLWFEPRWKLL